MERKKKVKVLDGRTAASFPMPLARALHRTGLLMEIVSEMHARGAEDGRIVALAPALENTAGGRYDGVGLKEKKILAYGLWQSVAGLVGPHDPTRAPLFLREARRWPFRRRSTHLYPVSLFGDDELHFVLDSLRGVTPPLTVNLCGSYRTFRRDGGVYGLREEPAGSRLVVRGLEARIAALCERFGEFGGSAMQLVLPLNLETEDGMFVREVRLGLQLKVRAALACLGFDLEFVTVKEDVVGDVVVGADGLPPAVLLDIYLRMSDEFVGSGKGTVWERN